MSRMRHPHRRGPASPHHKHTYMTQILTPLGGAPLFTMTPALGTHKHARMWQIITLERHLLLSQQVLGPADRQSLARWGVLMGFRLLKLHARGFEAMVTALMKESAGAVSFPVLSGGLLRSCMCATRGLLSLRVARMHDTISICVGWLQSRN